MENMVGDRPMTCVARLEATARARMTPAANLEDVPLVGDLKGYGEAGIWARQVVASVEAWRRGDGIWPAGTLNACLIAFSDDGYGVAADEVGNAPTIYCCDVYGNADGNYDSVVGDQTGISLNFSLDPELCGIEVADYRLFDTSPCRSVNSPCTWQVGAYGMGCDSPVEGMSWGGVKALYR